MDIDVHFAGFTLPAGVPIAPTLARTARVADQGGAAVFTLMDHYFQMEGMGGPAAPMLEGYTALGFVAAHTERLRLGLLVTGVTYRHPGLLAKIVTTLDVLSSGRAQLGIGAAWYEREHRGLGVPFPPLAERFERLEETLQICRQMWSDDDGPYEGTHYSLAETICVPRPISRGGPPVVVGGSGERKTLRLVARYADACNLFAGEPAEVARKVAVLHRHCEDAGRDPDDIRVTVIAPTDPLADPLADIDGFLTRMEALAGVGVSMVTLVPQGPDPVAWTTELMERVQPRLRQIGAAR
jgi:F420-dependent oxidoreductase-like protein